MEVAARSSFNRDVKKLTPDVKKDVKNAIENIRSASKLGEIKNLESLSGHKNAFRIRIGDYRIGVYILKSVVDLVRVVHRREIYDKFP